MRIVDPDHQWPLARQQRDEAPPRPLQLVLDVAVPRLATERRCERVGELVGILCAEAREALAERVVDACHRVLGAGSRRGTQDLAERPECDAAPVRWISPEEGLRSRVGRGEALGELAREAGLADPGVAGDRHQLGHPVTGGPAVDELEQCHVVVAADEGNARPHPLGAGGLRAPDPQRLGEALGLNRFRLVDLGGPAGPRGTLADQHLAGRRRLLEARRGVDGLAGDRQVVAARPVRGPRPSRSRPGRPVPGPWTRPARSGRAQPRPPGQGRRCGPAGPRTRRAPRRRRTSRRSRRAPPASSAPPRRTARDARGAPPGPGPTPSRSSRRGRRRPSSRAFAPRRQAPREASRTRGRTARHHPPKHRNEHRSEPCADDTLGPGATVARLHPGRAPGASEDRD